MNSNEKYGSEEQISSPDTGMQSHMIWFTHSVRVQMIYFTEFVVFYWNWLDEYVPELKYRMCTALSQNPQQHCTSNGLYSGVNQ